MSRRYVRKRNIQYEVVSTSICVQYHQQLSTRMHYILKGNLNIG